MKTIINHDSIPEAYRGLVTHAAKTLEEILFDLHDLGVVATWSGFTGAGSTKIKLSLTSETYPQLVGFIESVYEPFSLINNEIGLTDVLIHQLGSFAKSLDQVLKVKRRKMLEAVLERRKQEFELMTTSESYSAETI